MARGLSKKEKIERYDHVVSERDTYRIALKLALTSQPDGAASYGETEGTIVTVTLYGAARANGGYVISRHSYNGIPCDTDGIEAFAFEDWYRSADTMPFYGAAWIVSLKECARQLRARRNDVLGIV